MIYRAENLEMAVQALEDFIAEWKPKYRKVTESLEKTDNLLTFFSVSLSNLAQHLFDKPH